MMSGFVHEYAEVVDGGGALGSLAESQPRGWGQGGQAAVVEAGVVGEAVEAEETVAGARELRQRQRQADT